MDNKLWVALTPEQRAAFERPCVIRIAEYSPDSQNFRWLLDIRTCKSTEK
jgi:hypothetical protein